jgi:hypothetical protein
LYIAVAKFQGIDCNDRAHSSTTTVTRSHVFIITHPFKCVTVAFVVAEPFTACPKKKKNHSTTGTARKTSLLNVSIYIKAPTKLLSYD